MSYNTCIMCGADDRTWIRTVEEEELEAFKNRSCSSPNCAGCMLVPIQEQLEGIRDNDHGINYSNWFKKMPAKEKKIILGEYYGRCEAGESLKDITPTFTDGEAEKHFEDREAREEALEEEEAAKKEAAKVKEKVKDLKEKARAKIAETEKKRKKQNIHG